MASFAGVVLKIEIRLTRGCFGKVTQYISQLMWNRIVTVRRLTKYRYNFS